MDVSRESRNLSEMIAETNTCSSSDTDSDQTEEYVRQKRMKIKMKPKSPVRGYYKKVDNSVPKYNQYELAADGISENQMDCKLGREALSEMFENNDKIKEEGVVLQSHLAVLSEGEGRGRGKGRMGAMSVLKLVLKENSCHI